MKNIVFLIMLVMSLNVVRSQNKMLNFEAELRPRILIDNGYKSPKLFEEKPLAYITQRTRLNTGFQNNKLKAYLNSTNKCNF